MLNLFYGDSNLMRYLALVGNYNAVIAGLKRINKDMPLYKKVKTIEIRKEEFIKTTTKKIKRNANINNN